MREISKTYLNMMDLDFFLFRTINSFAGRWFWLDLIGIFFADYFGYFLVVAVFIFLLINKRKYLTMTILALTSAIFARFGIVELVRFFWPRPRPFVENNVKLLIDKVNQSAFPSSHAAFYFALAISIFLYNKKAGLLFFLGGFLISFFRVFVGVHWPSDILAGFLVGIFLGSVIFLFSRKFFSAVKK